MSKRIYVAEPVGAVLAPEAKKRLINAGTPAAARLHATRNLYNVRTATPHEVAELVGNGVKVEEAGDGQTGTLPATDPAS